MAKFNVIQKSRRAAIAERKRAVNGDTLTGKLKRKQQPLSVSGKRKRKILKKWRREQKEAMEKGLVSMQDVQMAVSQGTSEDANKLPVKFHLKKISKLKVKQLKKKGKNKRESVKQPFAEASVDAMVE